MRLGATWGNPGGRHRQWPLEVGNSPLKRRRRATKGQIPLRARVGPRVTRSAALWLGMALGRSVLPTTHQRCDLGDWLVDVLVSSA